MSTPDHDGKPNGAPISEVYRSALLRDWPDARAEHGTLAAPESQFRVLAETVGQFVWITNAQGMAEYLNPQWIEYTGISDCTNWMAALHPEDAPEAVAAWWHAVRTVQPFCEEFRVRRARDGEYRWFSSRGYPLQDGAGQVVRWFGICSDIEDLKRTQDELLALVKSREEFLSLASHELRTPLTTLRLQNDLLAARVADEHGPLPAREELVRIAENNAQQLSRLSRLVDDMLDITRLLSGRLKLDLQTHDLREIVQSCVERLAPLFNEAGASVPELHPYGEVLCVPCDRMRIEQVIDNLLVNSLKYGRKLPVTISYQCTTTHVDIAVLDRGIGIADVDQNRIFDRFYRTETEPMAGGLGLGLFIAKQIVEQHGGHIAVASEPGRGSKFVVRLPRPRDV